MTLGSLPPLSLGADVVSILLPHRRPFLMVDAIEGFSDGPTPALQACRSISVNEPVFEGHFPGLSLWPGVYTIEGLGQTANLLLVLLAMREHARARGLSPDLPHRALIELDRAQRLEPHDTRLTEPLLTEIGARKKGWNLGMSAAVNVKLQKPVFAGQRLTYFVEKTHELSGLMRFEVSAWVAGQSVARGTMTSTVAIAPTTMGEL